MVGEVKGIEMMGVLVAGRGARERGGRRCAGVSKYFPGTYSK